MPRKKKEEELDTQTAAGEAETSEEPIAVAQAADAPADQTADADAAEAPSIVESVVDVTASALESVATTIGKGAASLVSAITGSPEAPVKHSKRAEKIGVVSSDKMMKTVTVRVDRLVKHPVYRKYIKKRKKFMAHDELGAKIGDKVKIVETRPLSARKRWRVVEIIHKAEL